MSKWDTSSQRRDQAKKSIDTAQTKSDTMAGQIYNPMLAERTGARDRGLAEREAVRSNYSDIAGGKGAAGETFSNLRGMNVGNRNPGDYGSYGGFQDFAKTGGYSDQDKADIRSRSTSPMEAMYAANKANVARQSTVQGGYMPGYGASMAKMSRGTGQGLTDASRNAEMDIASSVRGNRLAGLSGMSEIEREAARNNLYGMRLGSENERWIGNQQLAANRGLESLYGTAPGEQGMYDSNLMGMYGMQTGSNQGLVNSRVNLAGQGDWLDQMSQGMGSASGLMNAFSKMPIGGSPGGSPDGSLPTTDFNSSYYAGDPSTWGAPSYYGNMSQGEYIGNNAPPTVDAWQYNSITGKYTPPSQYGIQSPNQPPDQYVGNSNAFGSATGLPNGYQYGQQYSYNPATGRYTRPGGGGGGGTWDPFFGNGYGSY